MRISEANELLFCRKKKKKTCDQIGHVAFLLIKTVLQDLSVPQASG